MHFLKFFESNWYFPSEMMIYMSFFSLGAAKKISQPIYRKKRIKRREQIEIDVRYIAFVCRSISICSLLFILFFRYIGWEIFFATRREKKPISSSLLLIELFTTNISKKTNLNFVLFQFIWELICYHYSKMVL